ncbi:mevalonate kinase [Ranunculus cassubicifolius]
MEIRSRAPGKIILSGEHAVVHGSSAVAASIDLHTHVSLKISTHPEKDEDLLRLHLKDMGLEFAWTIGKIKEVVGESITPNPSLPRSCSSDTIKVIANLVEEQNIPEAKIGLAAGVSAFYLAIHLYPWV